MDGIHDLGGKHGYGPVVMEDNEPVFHDRWEAAVFTMSGSGRRAGAWNNSDRFRHGVERIDPVAYLSQGYYGRWLGGIETLLVEAGVFTQAEITERASLFGGTPSDLIAARPARQPDPMGVVESGRTARREADTSPALKVDDRVKTVAAGSAGHTRLPAYARGRRGRIIASQGCWVFPDTNAHGEGEQQRYLYTVEFLASELWGSEADDRVSVCLDLFEPYLERSDD